MNYDALLPRLREAYDARVEEREQMGVDDWKQEIRIAFLQRLQAEGCRTLVELGAGPGTHGRWFADHGLAVTCVDLSPAMAEACRAKGLEAYAQDFLSLDLPTRYEAGFALNCLLHVPPSDLSKALQRIRLVLQPGALLYVGQYGGIDWQGINPEDRYEPKRYFSLRTDDQLRQALQTTFEVLDFERFTLPNARPGTWDFQSATLRASAQPER